MEGWSPALRDFIWELSGRKDVLTICWLTALADVRIFDNVDGTPWDVAIVALKPVQPLLAKTLEDWLKRQDELQPVLKAVAVFLPSLEVTAVSAMNKLLELAARDFGRWDVLSSMKNVDSIGLDSCKAEAPWFGRVLRATGFLLGDGELVFNHIWAQANQAEKLFVDIPLFRWGSNDNLVFELRTQLYRLPWPLENRETLLVRMGRKIDETKWAVVCSSVVVDHELLAAKDVPVRAQVWLDGYVVEQLGHGLCRVVRIFHLDPVADGGTLGFLSWTQETRFGITKSIENIRERARDHKLIGVPVFVGAAVAGGVAAPLAATGMLSLLGFGAGGVVAGSWAAGAMGASVAAGSNFALAQSAGVVGLSAGPIGLLVVSGAIVVGGASIGIYYLVKHVKQRAEQAKFLETMENANVHVCETCGLRNRL